MIEIADPTVGYVKFPANHYFPTTKHTHSHLENEMILILSGSVSVITDSFYLRHVGACVILYKAGCDHCQINYPEQPYERYYFRFMPSLLGESARDRMALGTLFSEEASLIPLNTTSVERVAPAAALIYRIYSETGGILDRRIEYLLKYMLSEIGSSEKARNLSSFAACDAYFFELLKYISRNLDKPLTLKLLSDKFFISRSKLSRDFQKFLSVSFHDYLTEERIGCARMLISQKKSLAEVAEATGFYDASHLTHVFQKKYGFSPSHFK